MHTRWWPTRRIGRTLPIALSAVILAGLGAGPTEARQPTRHASIPAPAAGTPSSWHDFNADGFADLAIGAPFDDVNGKAQAGVVHVIYGWSTGLDARKLGPHPAAQLWHQGRAGVADKAEKGDRFGWSLASGDFDGDGYADLAIGVPFEDVDGAADFGGVNLLFGSATGLVARDYQSLWRVPGLLPAVPHSRFGFALAALDAFDLIVPFGQDPDGIAELAVSGPGLGEGFIDVAGGGFLVVGTVIPGQHQLLALAGAGREGGRSLAVGDFDSIPFDDLAIGTPYRDIVNGHGHLRPDAGGALVLYNGDGTLHEISEHSFLPDRAQKNARLGESLGVVSFDGVKDELVIGAPRRDVLVAKGHPLATDAGWAYLVGSTPTGLDPDQVLAMVEGVFSVPGHVRAHHRFATAIVFADFNADGGPDEAPDWVFSAPGDTVNGHAGAGSGPAAYNRQTTTRAQRITQDVPGIPEVAEKGDGFGSVLAAADFNGDGAADLVVGVPLEDRGSMRDAGVVHVLYGFPGAARGLRAKGSQLWHQDVRRIAEAAQAGDRFGWAVH